MDSQKDLMSRLSLGHSKTFILLFLSNSDVDFQVCLDHCPAA